MSKDKKTKAKRKDVAFQELATALGTAARPAKLPKNMKAVTLTTQQQRTENVPSTPFSIPAGSQVPGIQGAAPLLTTKEDKKLYKDGQRAAQGKKPKKAKDVTVKEIVLEPFKFPKASDFQQQPEPTKKLTIQKLKRRIRRDEVMMDHTERLLKRILKRPKDERFANLRKALESTFAQLDADVQATYEHAYELGLEGAVKPKP